MIEHKKKIRCNCIDCEREDEAQYNPFGDDTLKLCDGCGDNWVCIKCNSLEAINENGNDKYYCIDCNQHDDTYIDDECDPIQEIEIEQLDDFNDQHGYTTMCLFHPI